MDFPFPPVCDTCGAECGVGATYAPIFGTWECLSCQTTTYPCLGCKRPIKRDGERCEECREEERREEAARDRVPVSDRRADYDYEFRRDRLERKREDGR